MLMLNLARNCPIGHYLEHKIVQLNPEVPEKTTNCVAVGISFAVEEKDVPKLTEHVLRFIKENTFSNNTSLAVFQGLKVPKEVEEYGLRAKRAILSVDEAKKVAARNGVQLIGVTGDRGSIGAVAGIGCFDMGLASAALSEDMPVVDEITGRPHPQNR